MTTLKLGLIGVGRIGQMHASSLDLLTDRLACDGVKLEVLVADAVAETAQGVAARHGFTACNTVEDLLDSAPDGILIATGTATHPRLIHEGISRGIPVLCEKPLAESVEAAIPILREIEASGVPVQIGHQRRFDPGYQEAKRQFTSGEVGWIHTLRAVTCDAQPPAIEFLATSGGIFRDCSVHDFDMIRWLTGQEIESVFACGANKGDPRISEVGDVDTAIAMVTLTDGTIGTVAATRYNGHGHDVRLEIQGSKKSLVVGLDEQSALSSAEAGIAFPAGEPHATFAERFAGAYVREIEAFIDVLQGKRENPCPARESVIASLVADAAQESLRTGAPVAVPSFATTMRQDQKG